MAPDEELTKIDAVRLINNILNREKAGKVSAKLLGAVPDASPQLSDYAELLEAALGHEYEIVDGVERWTKNDNSRAMPQASSRLGRTCTTSTGPAPSRAIPTSARCTLTSTAADTSGMPELDELFSRSSPRTRTTR